MNYPLFSSSSVTSTPGSTLDKKAQIRNTTKGTMNFSKTQQKTLVMRRDTQQFAEKTCHYVSTKR